MTIKNDLQKLIDNLPESQLYRLLDYAESLASQLERSHWQQFARQQFARAYGANEPHYDRVDSPDRDKKHAFVYPNVSALNRGGRGGLSQRAALARATQCGYVEIPADLIKNKTEVKKTGLDLGEFLTTRAVAQLYDEGSDSEIVGLGYVLHTEPSLPRKNGYGSSRKAPLKWFDKKWVTNFSKMISRISRRLGTPAAAIEIHPGDRRNSYKDILESCRFLLDRYEEEFSHRPLVMLENRTGQFVSTGDSLARLWEAVKSEANDLTESFGIVLDFQQLWTVTRGNFHTNLWLIPHDAIKGVHVHYHHQCPSIECPIPWTDVAQYLGKCSSLLVNPEIHNKNDVPTAIDFCKKQLFKQST